jgi:cytosine/adenosine deaminase-related metal-dependent hydrolase
MTTVLAADWVLPVSAPPIACGAVAIEDGLIAAVGTQDELGKGIDYADSAILPGFVNAHSHLEYAVYAGFADGLSFVPWITTHVERKRRLDLVDHLDIARLGAAESLASGITTTGDASFTGAAAQACTELGLRAIVYLETFGADPRDALAAFAEKRFEPSDLVRPGISPHAPYTVSLAAYEACLGLGLPTSTHLAESDAEDDYVRRGEGPMAGFTEILVEPYGRTAIRALAAEGLLTRNLMAAHCVTVDDEEIELLARHGVAVAHCPRSNALLGCGIAPLRRLLDAGLTVGLGTDSPASTPSFDMFEELRAAIFFARARERRPEALGAAEALELATLGSAGALGVADEVGSLEPGKRADLVVLSLEGSPFLPWEDPAAAVVLGGARDRVAATLVDGEVRYERGAFDWHELRQRGTSARDRLLGRPRNPGA